VEEVFADRFSRVRLDVAFEPGLVIFVFFESGAPGRRGHRAG